MSDPIRSRSPRPELAEPLWRNRDFVVLRAGQAVSQLGSQMSRVVLPLLVLGLTRSPALTGLVSLVSGLPVLLFGLPLGAAIDRWDRRAVMAGTAAGLALATGSIAIAVLTNRLSVVQVVAAGLTASIFSTAYGTAEGAAIPQVVSSDQISVAMAQNEAVTRTSQLIGPPIGGALFGIARSLPFIADAVSSGVLVGALLTLKTDLKPHRDQISRRVWADIAEGLSWVRDQRFILATLLLTAGANVLLTGVYLLVIVLARDGGAPAAAIGLIFAFEAVFAIGGTWLAPLLSRRLSMAQVVIGSHWLWVVFVPLYLVSPHVAVLGVVTGLIFGLSPIRNVILISYQVRIIPNHLRGKVGSVAGLITAGPMPLGAALCGLLLQMLGTGSTIAVFTAGAFLLALAATASPAIRWASST